MVYATRGTVEALLELAADAEPRQVTVGLSVTRAGTFPDPPDLPPQTPVFTHFYLPDAGESVSAVFGVDLSTPLGQTQGRFVSHPQGDLDVSREDDLHDVVLVAVPPWDEASIAAFGRDGRRLDLSIVEAHPPDEGL
ncbi:hypothetical protein BRC81_03920 [Halobacteriales archaeon QS_1_68_20]|nr:MAG: hypothetical protein BRC81_03920 [Halobacteriales archaeon QS_1_68_20]